MIISFSQIKLLQEEELRASADPKYAHFNDDLHVEITAFAPPAEAHARIAYALAEVRKFLVPVSLCNHVPCADFIHFSANCIYFTLTVLFLRMN